MNSRSNPDARKPAPSNSMPQPNNVNNFSNMNDQSRAFIQASFAPNFSSNAQLNDQSRAFIQSSFIPQSHNVSSSQNNANAFSSKLKVSGSVDPNTEHIKTLKYDDDDPLADQMVVKLENTSPNVDELTHLSMRMKRKNLQSSSFNEQTLPFVVSLAVDDLKSVNKVPIDLVCVIDHSGSMNGEKIQLVRNTFNYLLKYLNDADRLSIVIFDDKASRHIPFLRTTEFNKKRIMSAVRNIQGGGGTDINLGIMHAFQVLQQRRYINPMTSIFLLSDGLDGGAQKKVQASLNAFNIQEDITINTFGFGNDHDPQLMTDIANLRDGNFYFIEKLDTIDEAFVDCLGGLQSSVAQNVQINIKAEQSEFLQGVQIPKAHGDLSMWNFDNGVYITKMATLMSGKQKDYVLEIKIPTNPKQLLDHQKNITIATAEAIITGLDNKVTVKKADLTITLFNEIEEFKDEEEEDDREVMKNFYRVKGASLMDEARQLADNKRNEDAKKLLQNFKEEVQNSYLKNEEFIKNLLKDIDQAIKDFNPVIYQEVGRHNIYNNQRAQMHQRSALNSNVCYQNNQQAMMINEVRALKNKKPF